MRRSTKPFTVEVKKRGGRRRDSGDGATERVEPVLSPSMDTMVGRDIRFRDAESLFRGQTLAEEAPTSSLPQAATTPDAPADVSTRRILPDLIAEAALSEATLAATPEPRRRGRPPKMRTGDVLPHPARKRGRKPSTPVPVEALSFFDVPEPVPAPPAPAVLYLAASARRRAARATDNLPRAERWKRRLPKACW